MTMRAVYSTNVFKEALVGMITRMRENGLNIEKSSFYDGGFFTGEGINKVVIVVAGSTIYVNKLGSFIPKVLEKNEIQFGFSQHAKAPPIIEEVFRAEESA